MAQYRAEHAHGKKDREKEGGRRQDVCSRMDTDLVDGTEQH